MSILGRPIETLPAAANGVPIFLHVVCNFIKAHSATRGVFRRSANPQVRDQLAHDLCGHTPEICHDATVHDVGLVLRSWLMALPRPLIDPELVERFYDEQNPATCVAVIERLCDRDRGIVFLLLDVAQTVIDADNMMDLRGVDICFWGVVTRKKGPRLADMLQFFPVRE